MICEHCGSKVEDFKTIKHEGKEFRIYKWENKPFNTFKVQNGFRIIEFQELNKLIEDKLIKYSGEWEVFFTKHFNKLFKDKGLSSVCLYVSVLSSDYGDLADSNSNGRVVVVK